MSVYYERVYENNDHGLQRPILGTYRDFRHRKCTYLGKRPSLYIGLMGERSHQLCPVRCPTPYFFVFFCSYVPVRSALANELTIFLHRALPVEAFFFVSFDREIEAIHPQEAIPKVTLA